MKIFQNSVGQKLFEKAPLNKLKLVYSLTAGWRLACPPSSLKMLYPCCCYIVMLSVNNFILNYNMNKCLFTNTLHVNSLSEGAPSYLIKLWPSLLEDNWSNTRFPIPVRGSSQGVVELESWPIYNSLESINTYFHQWNGFKLR